MHSTSRPILESRESYEASIRRRLATTEVQIHGLEGERLCANANSRLDLTGVFRVLEGFDPVRTLVNAWIRFHMEGG